MTTGQTSGPDEDTLRIDRLLWFLRFARTRSAAQSWVQQGHIRSNKLRVEKLNHPVKVGDVLTLPLASGPLIIEILALPIRRGPAEEARSHYRELDPRPKNAIATQE